MPKTFPSATHAAEYLASRAYPGMGEDAQRERAYEAFTTTRVNSPFIHEKLRAIIGYGHIQSTTMRVATGQVSHYVEAMRLGVIRMLSRSADAIIVGEGIVDATAPEGCDPSLDLIPALRIDPLTMDSDVFADDIEMHDQARYQHIEILNIIRNIVRVTDEIREKLGENLDDDDEAAIATIWSELIPASSNA